MTQGRWRHMSMLDVDLVVLNSVLIGSEWSCHVFYWNRYFNFVHETEVVHIKNEDLWKWSRV